MVDNVDQEELHNDMKELLLGAWMRESEGHVLVTTRREPKEIEETFKAELENCIVLGPMNTSESIDFMLKRTVKDKCDEYLEHLVDDLHGLPLAMEQAAAHIKALECSFGDYLEEFQKKRLKLSQRPISTTYTTSKERLAVRTTWQINFDYICKQSEEELLGNTVPFVMNVAAYYYGDDIPEELFNKGDPEIDIDDVKKTMKSSLGVKQVTEILTRFSLFQRSGKGRFQVHRLVQEVIRDNNDDPRKKAIVIQGAVKMLNAALKRGLSPIEALETQRGSENLRGALHLWNRLGATACTVRSHALSFVQSHEEFRKEILWQFEIIKVFQTSALYHSIYQRQAEALAIQEEMLRIISLSNISIEQQKEFTSLTVPIHEKDRKKLNACIESTISQNNDQESESNDATLLRELGNDAFRTGKVQEAIQLYTEAVRSSKAGEIDARLYSNRSLCFLNIEDFERALEDANNCILIEPNSWKAHCFRALAIANLVKAGQKPKEMEGFGIASASIAAHIYPLCKNTNETKTFYPNLRFNIVQNSDKFTRLDTTNGESLTTFFLTKGRYDLGQFLVNNNLQILGIDDNVELVVGVSLFWRWYVNHFLRKRLRIHFENIRFVKGGIQFQALVFTTFTFNKCHFSNGQETCKEYPRCKGGSGCKNPDPNGCQTKFEKLMALDRGSGFFHTGVTGHSGITAADGGKVFLERCTLDSCGGGGALSTGKGSVLNVSNCVIVRNQQQGLEAREGGKLIAVHNDIRNNGAHGVLIGPSGTAILRFNYISCNDREGIYAFELNRDEDEILEFCPESKSCAFIEENVISYNGLCGISLDGGTFIINSNKIYENWFWGITAKTRSSCNITNNDIYNNNCGGIRIGFNFSGIIYIDGNSIRDHTGPHIFFLDYPSPMKDMLKHIDWTKESTRKFLGEIGINNPEDEPMHYTTPPIVTNRNAFLRNKLTKHHPLHVTELLVENSCSFCHQNGRHLNRCSECRKAFYCSSECQHNHWKMHKHFCRMFKENFTVSIKMEDTWPNAPHSLVHEFDPYSEGIHEGPKPDRSSSKRFIVKLQSGHEYSLYNPYNKLVLSDRSVDVDICVKSPVLYHLIMECGVLCTNSFTAKKIFCWASFDDMGRVIKVYTDILPPYQKW